MPRTPEEQRQKAAEYFDMLADIGITKHLGSLEATKDILERAQVDAGSLILDVGCGIGLTPAWLVRNYGARVVGIDITFGMLKQAHREPRKRGVADRVHYCVADAAALPFAEGTFDMVMAESVYVFVPDRSKAFDEAVRVTAPGGHVGVTESTWLSEPGPKAYDFMASMGGEPVVEEAWVALMRDAGLEDVTSKTARVDVRAEARGRMERFGLGTLLRSASQLIPTLLRNPKSRRVLGRALGNAPTSVARDMGYGVYTGRKPTHAEP